MNILVKKEDLSDSTPLHGGEYAVVEVEIHVDAKLPLREQRKDRSPYHLDRRCLRPVGGRMTLALIGYFTGLFGLWFVQDGIASIMFYPTEKWKWNHAVRLIRVCFGAILMAFGLFLIYMGFQYRLLTS